MAVPLDARRVDVRGLPDVDSLPEPLRSRVVRHDGVTTTGMLARAGVTDTVTARRVRAGAWQRLHRGVVLLQSGVPSWRQRAQGAVLAAGRDAALSHRSAGYAHGLVTSPGPVLVVSVPAERTVDARAGLRVHRRREMPRASGSLRCTDVAGTAVDLVAHALDDDAVVAVLCEAVRLGVPRHRLLAVLDGRARLRHRRLAAGLLGDPDARVESPLEHRYDRDVERAHGLPRSQAQVRERLDGGWVRADRRFERLGMRVELDGRLAHAGRADGDVWRDNAVRVAGGDVTLRYRWRHVVTTPCATAAQLAAALHARGWRGTLLPCGPGCAA
ncbi:hypothetical protein [Cellulomonas phragmiteti]|uniref:Transcriptional regulator, AbiEi antitoxin, Type IV TA system n=1 Tax=Cellulomonas phragmiteti TaxID=478780 RepID=A0ABQ4DNJ1_9CELL|nr:hypothetical protein [Cellulomonas phragmiteti]GIG40908.1 hypothetical protein Cph01nite_26700 [Cellulomonas phragmiteti]